MNIFSWLFGRRRSEDMIEDETTITEPEIGADTPMAGAGAQVAADTKDAKARKELDDAVLRDQARW